MALKYPHTLLLVDDEIAILNSLKRLLRKDGFTIITAQSGPDALEKMSRDPSGISLIISDQRMPGMTGAQFLERALEMAPDAVRFILTGYADMDAIIDAVNKGKIHHYFTKPWNDDDLLDKVRTALAQVELRLENIRLTELTERQNQELSELNKTLEKKVEERTWALQIQFKQAQKANAALEKSFMDAIRLLVSLVESSNPRLGTYMKAVSLLTRELAADAGLDEAEQTRIEIAGLVHDIGLLGMADTTLEKDYKVMTPEESSAYREHPIIAAMSLSSIGRLKEIGDLVMAHHENVDGSGYPRRLVADQIPLGAKILAVAADYHTVIHMWPDNIQRMLGYARRYLDTETVAAARIDDASLRTEIAEKIIERGAGTRYDTFVVSLFLRRSARRKPFQEDLKLPYQALKAGMILRQDLRLKDGRLLLNRGSVLNEKTVQSIQGIGERGLIDKPVEVAEPNTAASEGGAAS